METVRTLVKYVPLSLAMFISIDLYADQNEQYQVNDSIQTNNAGLTNIAAQKKSINISSTKTDENITGKADENDKIWEDAEIQAQFSGGNTELAKWLSANIKYPEQAQKDRIEGRVLVKFVIWKDGSISNAKIIRGKNPDLNAEALRVVESMPRWEPAQVDGHPVHSYFLLPISFKL